MTYHRIYPRAEASAPAARAQAQAADEGALSSIRAAQAASRAAGMHRKKFPAVAREAAEKYFFYQKFLHIISNRFWNGADASSEKGIRFCKDMHDGISDIA